jgi:acyl-CoA synthetase (AMP-forming)/AMP-acid ligase II
MTETAAMVSALGTEDFLSGVFHAGCSLNHATIRIINPAGEECPSGTTGRIQVVSRALFSGYHGVETDGLKHHCYLTDDEGYLDKEGQLHVLGRVDRLIQSGGEKVDPGEVEAAMLNVSGVEAALVIGQADTEWVQRVVAFYVGGADVAVLSHLSGQLTAYKIPKLCLRVDALPLNESGKLDRAKVAALLADA